MVRGVSEGWSPSPWFLVTPPQSRDGVIPRPRLSGRFDDAVAAHRVTFACAPAGFGKTLALAEWATERSARVAWLSLTHLDTDEATLLSGIVTALRRLAQSSGDEKLRWLSELSPRMDEVAGSYRSLMSACERVDSPLVLVLDDAHLAPYAVADGVLAAVLRHGPENLRLVLSSRNPLEPRLAPARLVGEPSTVGPDELGFVVDEVLTLAGALGRPLTVPEAAQVREATSGWPVAVRLSLAERAEGEGRRRASTPAPAADGTLVDDYVDVEVLGRLPAGLADFVLAATTTDRTAAPLAQELTGRADSGALLEECVRRGLFLDRFAGADGDVVYRWHEVFSVRCRRILRRRDPQRSDLLCRRAGRFLADTFPLLAAELAVRGHDPALATAVVREHWLELVLGSRARALDALVASLPAPWSTSPDLLLVRSCCRDLLRDRPGARRLRDRALAGADAGGAGAAPAWLLLTSVAALFLEDDEQLLARACDDLDARLRAENQLAPRVYACALFLLGWTLLRLRRDPSHALQVLTSAMAECRAVGADHVARLAGANLGFALAFAGRLRQALTSVDVPDGDVGEDEWGAYDGGISRFTKGYVAYWQDDLETAEEAVRAVAEQGGGYADLARIYWAFVAAHSADRTRRAAAARELELVSDSDEHGLPWPAYRRLARAKLLEAEGDLAGAIELVRELEQLAAVPVTTAMVAELHRRSGDLTRARELVDSQQHLPLPSYVRVSLLVTSALVLRQQEDPEGAHGTLELALDLAEPEGIARPFGDGDPELRGLLADHARWGTRHEELVAGLLSRAHARPGPDSGHAALTAREREILGYLRTTMTIEDIAAALSVSVNTVRTHQRSIYRKLNVSKRREAIRVQI